MILVYSVVLLIFLAILLRRDLSQLGQVTYRGGWKVAAAVGALFLLQAATILYVSGQSPGQIVILILSQVALICLFLLNRHLPGALLFALGILLNTIVMVANGGLMPVTPETAAFVHPERSVEMTTKPASSKNIVLPRADTNLWILSDIIRINLSWHRNAVSVGDVLLILGIARFLFQSTSPSGRVRYQAGSLP